MRTCPSCDSEKIRRGGMIIWLIYVALIAFAIVATLVFRLNAAIVAGIMIAVVVISPTSSSISASASTAAINGGG